MDPASTALILIGYQNDYFANDGTLADFIEDRERVQDVRSRTIPLVEKCLENEVLVISTPILFTENYEEVRNPIGILAAIQERGAFRRGQPGSAVIEDFDRFGEQMPAMMARHWACLLLWHSSMHASAVALLGSR